jgi:hypothetical protein
VAVSVEEEVVDVWVESLPPPLLLEEDDDSPPAPTSILHCFSSRTWVDPSAAVTGDKVTVQVVVIVPASVWLVVTVWKVMGWLKVDCS